MIIFLGNMISKMKSRISRVTVPATCTRRCIVSKTKAISNTFLYSGAWIYVYIYMYIKDLPVNIYEWARMLCDALSHFLSSNS